MTTKSTTRKQVSRPTSTITEEDLGELRRACRHLEHPSLAARLSTVVGTPIEVGLQLLPKSWHDGIQRTAHIAIIKAMESALSSMRRKHEPSAHELFYKGLVAGSGAVGGLFGLPGLLVELPITTTLMLRSIAEIARDQGEDIQTDEAKTACLEVFALGGRSEMDDTADTGYYGIRLISSSYLTVTALRSSGLAIIGESVPATVEFIQTVSARFGAELTTRAAARTLPLIGAATAATVNLIFIQHFQDMARSHFTIRRLERRYGADTVQKQYEQIALVY